jgi:hypothetical protein
MTNRYFNVLTPDQAIFDGVNKLNSGSDAVYRGMLAGWPSGGRSAPARARLLTVSSTTTSATRSTWRPRIWATTWTAKRSAS